MSNAYSFDMEKYCRVNWLLNEDDLIRSFPYRKYLNSVSFTNFITLQKHREYLQRHKDKKNGNRLRTMGDDFLYYLGEHFMKYYPITKQNIVEKIDIAELYIKPGNKGFGFMDYRKNEIYQTIGYFIVGRIASFIQEEIKKKQWNITTSEHQFIERRLRDNKIYLSIQTDTLTKLISHIQKGNYQYIFNRIYCKLQGVFYSIVNYLKNVDYLKNYIKLAETKLTLRTYRQYYPRNGQHDVNIFQIYDQNRLIGYSIWLKRPALKSNYFAYRTKRESVYHRYLKWKNKIPGRVVLVTTGGFTNQHKQPEGLTVEHGKVVNAVILPERHGLVIVSKEGLRVANLKRGSFTLPITSTKATKPLNPLNSLMDFSEMMKWCIKNDATLFQTQLLAYSNRLLIDKTKARKNPRERRILALITDRNNNVQHIIFHIEKNYNLADITEHIFELLQSRSNKIEAILNLDVGSYNILDVYDNRSNKLRAVTGPVSISKATNLIVYTR